MDKIKESLKENIEEMLCERFKVLELTPEIEDMSLEILDNIKNLVEDNYELKGSSLSGILPL